MGTATEKAPADRLAALKDAADKAAAAEKKLLDEKANANLAAAKAEVAMAEKISAAQKLAAEKAAAEVAAATAEVAMAEKKAAAQILVAAERAAAEKAPA